MAAQPITLSCTVAFRTASNGKLGGDLGPRLLLKHTKVAKFEQDIDIVIRFQHSPQPPLASYPGTRLPAPLPPYPPKDISLLQSSRLLIIFSYISDGKLGGDLGPRICLNIQKLPCYVINFIVSFSKVKLH